MKYCYKPTDGTAVESARESKLLRFGVKSAQTTHRTALKSTADAAVTWLLRSLADTKMMDFQQVWG